MGLEGLEARRSALPRRTIEGRGQGEEPAAPCVRAGQASLQPLDTSTFGGERINDQKEQAFAHLKVSPRRSPWAMLGIACISTGDARAGPSYSENDASRAAFHSRGRGQLRRP